MTFPSESELIRKYNICLLLRLPNGVMRFEKVKRVTEGEGMGSFLALLCINVSL